MEENKMKIKEKMIGFMMKKMMKKMPKMMEKCMGGMDQEKMEKMKERMQEKKEGCFSKITTEPGDDMADLCSKMFKQVKDSSPTPKR
jgi:hypothetical protein